MKIPIGCYYNPIGKAYHFKSVLYSPITIPIMFQPAADIPFSYRVRRKSATLPPRAAQR